MSFLIDIFRRTDWKLFAAAGLLLGAGLVSLASTSPDSFHKQLMWLAIGAVLMGIILIMDLRSFFASGVFIRIIYAASLLLLVATLFLAPAVKGNRAWLFIGSFQFQPAEFAKLALILILSYYFSTRHVRIGRLWTIAGSFLYFVLPAGLIALQPDLGSALILFFVWFGFLLLSELPLKRLLLAALLFLIAFYGMWTFVLKDYQKDRIMGLFDPQRDPLGVNYNVIQSKIAIGSGGLFGKGFGQGTQVQLGFLPEAQTDFIFSAIAEEGGMFAVLLVVGAFAWMVFRLIAMAQLMEGNVFKFICLGSAILFLVQFIFNVGSNLGFFPVVGVTFPFLSYGGSSILVNMLLLGVLQSVYSKK